MNTKSYCFIENEPLIEREHELFGTTNEYELLKKTTKKVEIHRAKNKIVIQSYWKPVGYDWDKVARDAGLKRNPWVVWVNAETLEKRNLNRRTYFGVANDREAIRMIGSNQFSDPIELDKMIGWIDFYQERVAFLESENVGPEYAIELACEQTDEWIRLNEYKMKEMAEKFLDSLGIALHTYLESGLDGQGVQQ